MTHPIYQDLSPEDLGLDNIFLDPNNPRFITINWDYIQDDFIDNDKIQEDIAFKLDREFGISGLVTNMEINGYLPIDRVIVKKFADNKYYVLEGNRRIAAAKKLLKKSKDPGSTISDEVLSSLNSIPTLVYTGDNDEASWIFQGLRHIMGIKEWSAYNKAKLLVKLIEDEGLTLTDVGKKFGLSAFGAGQWARGYYALMQAKEESDYTEELNEKAFPFFQEIFNRSNAPLREWLEWNDKESKFTDDLKFNEFLSWLYPKDLDLHDEEQDVSVIRGEWSSRKIRTAQTLRTLSYIIRNNTREFEIFRNELEIEKSYNRVIQKEYEDELKKTANPTEEIMETVDQCIKSLQNVPFTVFNDPVLIKKLTSKLDSLRDKIKVITDFNNG